MIKTLEYLCKKNFGITNNLNFHIVKWHDDFDALLGSKDFMNIKAKNTKTLETPNVKFQFLKN